MKTVNDFLDGIRNRHPPIQCKNNQMSFGISLSWIKQIKAGFIYRILSAFALFAATPYLVKALGLATYGKWSLYASAFAWILMLDFGASNQLRNVSRAIIDNKGDIKELSSLLTGGVIISVVCASVALLPVLLYLDEKISTIFLILLISLCAVTVNCYKALLNSYENTHLVILLTGFPNFFILGTVLLLPKQVSFATCMISFGLGIAASWFIAAIILRKKKIILSKDKGIYKKLKDYHILSKGISFFILQIISLALLASDRLFIYNIFGATEAGKYDVIFKLFSILMMFSSVLNNVLWTQFSKHTNTKNGSVINNIFKKLDASSGFFLVIVMILCLFANKIILLWVGDSYKFSSTYLFGYGAYILGFYLISTYAAYLNGAGLLTSQITAQLIAVAVKSAVIFLIIAMLPGKLSPEIIVLTSGFIMLTLAVMFRRFSKNENL